MAEYYKHEIAKWNVATDNLTLEQEAAYHRVVSQIRLYERPFKENFRVLAGLWRCNERKAKRLLSELVDAGLLILDCGLIVDEKAVKDASILSQLRIDKQSAGRQGGINSGNSRRKSLENKETGEAPASTKLGYARLDKSKEDDADDSAGEISGFSGGVEQSPREQILAAIGVSPDGVVGPGAFIGGQGDMAEAEQWAQMPGMTLNAICEEIARIMSRKRDGPPKRFSYFTRAMQELSGQLTAPQLDPIQGAPNDQRTHNRQPAQGGNARGRSAHQTMFDAFQSVASERSGRT